MKMKRIISTVLAVLMLISAFAFTTTSAATSGEVKTQTWKTKSSQPTLDYFTGRKMKDSGVNGAAPEVDTEAGIVINTPEDKLSYMDLRFEKDGYQLYVDHYSGEVATRCIATGEILFSNPYTIGSSTASNTIKEQLMSQIIVSFTDITTGDTGLYTSYKEAAQRNQILVKNIKNGVRVEYTIGREEARMLVPYLISKESFEKNIKNVLLEAKAELEENKKVLEENRAENKDAIKVIDDKVHGINQFLFAYIEQNPNDPNVAKSSSLLDKMYKDFPITKKMAVYSLDKEVQTQSNTLQKFEDIIKTYCPDYTYEQLDEDHMLTEYEGEDKNPPLFKMALEYTLDELGMTVRLPANGIRFNEALYRLEYIEILPYMGAGAKSNKQGNFSEYNSGYTFFPDGSGALFDFEKITALGSAMIKSGKVYGNDYAYHTLPTTPHQQVIRYPVFGITSTQDMTALENLTYTTTGAGSNAKFNVSVDCDVPKEERDYKSSGFVAIIEEGDALVELSTYHAVSQSEYNTVRMKVYPRPKDEYSISDGTTTGASDTWTVVSSRKYTGGYSVRYIMLTDDDTAASKGITDYYDCNYVGMARAYREYLEGNGTLTRLTEENVGNDIPLYIETFGAIYTTQRILSMPVSVMTPLTTFEDIQTMRDSLADEGIENINFILKGFTEGGLVGRKMPYNVDWEDAVSEEMSFEELLAYADDKDFGVYPDFDFAYTMSDYMFDGVSLSKHAVKTIDDRYTSKREYSATKQTYVSYYELAISPAYYVHFYEKFTEEYGKYNPKGVSVSTLGSDLNSDFDEDEPYNREDSKGYTIEALKHMSENYEKVMTSGGNAYAWNYVDYITDIALDSSRFSTTSISVPFLGMVLHGYVEIAGTPINMEGNIDYAILKAIENGASIKFILSYRNTSNLKKYEDLSKYYSIRYDIWYDDVVSIYNDLNDALSGVQTSLIETHEFIDGVRIPDADELLEDATNTLEKALAMESAYLKAQAEAEKDSYRVAREEVANFSKYLNDNFYTHKKNYDNALQIIVTNLNKADASLAKIEEYTGIITNPASKPADINSAVGKMNLEKANLILALNLALNSYNDFSKAADEYDDAIKNACNAYYRVENEYKALVENDPNLTEAHKNDILASFKDGLESEIIAPVIIAGYNDSVDACQLSDAAKKTAYKDLTDIDAVITAINADAELSDAQKSDLVKQLNYIKNIDELYTSGDLIQMAQDNINKKLSVVRAEITELVQNPIFDEEENTEDQTGDDQSEEQGFALPEEVVCTFKPDDAIGSEIREPVSAPEYKSDENKIVYEVYDNGTAFLLNFNNYKVMVVVDGATYVLDAYGYIVLGKKN